MTFDVAVNFVLDQEGGVSTDPNDPGGLTNFGISQKAYPGVDIRKLTREDAIGIYRKDFWDVIHGDSLPPGVAITLLDTAVNHGPATAVRLLQSSLGVRTDGVVGEATLTAAATKPQAKLLAEFMARRLNAYGLNPAFTRYGFGWCRRVMQLYELALENV